MLRVLTMAAPIVLASMTVPVAAPAAAAWQDNSQQCQQNSEERRRRGRGIGSMLGGIAGALGGRMGGVGGMIANNLPIGEMLGEAIAALLDTCEQQKAAAATDEALRGGVGTRVEWTSDTRQGVTGSSEVTAREEIADGGDCMTVTDIVIVDGEETRAPKRMCRRPPSNRYVRV